VGHVGQKLGFVFRGEGQFGGFFFDGAAGLFDFGIFAFDFGVLLGQLAGFFGQFLVGRVP